MTVVFFGTSAFGLPALESLSRSHSLSAIVTQPDKPSGRNLAPKPSPVKEWAEKHALRVLEFSNETEKVCLAEIVRLKPDVLVVISFGRILKEAFLRLPKAAAINVHASLLPRWRGASPMQSAILAGDKETGVSVMRMVEKLDAGDVLLSKPLAMDLRETILSLEPKLALLGASALTEALKLLETGRAQWVKQEEGRVTLCSKIKKDDGRLKWSEPAEILDRKVRAFLSWPGAFTFAGEKRLLVKKSRVEPHAKGPGGTVLKTGQDGIWIAAAQDALVLEEIQQEGRKPMSAADFLKGFPLKTGEVLL